MDQPERIGRYTIEKPLGEGGMARVYLAESEGIEGFKKRVVVKVVRPELAGDRRYQELFLREAKLAARLNHPNVVQIFDLGEDDGRYFMAMEFLEGLALSELCKRVWSRGMPLDLDGVLRAAADAALGLHHAHTLDGERGLVHRDISPDNLFMVNGGLTKVVDFGIAKAEDTALLTKTNELRGKLPFMAPEYLKGDPVDGRADLYALGVTLYFMLSGHYPYRDHRAAVLVDKILKGDARRLRERNPEVPASVDALVSSLLSAAPEGRPVDGHSVHDALLAACTDARHTAGAATMLSFAKLVRLNAGQKIKRPSPAARFAALSEDATIPLPMVAPADTIKHVAAPDLDEMEPTAPEIIEPPTVPNPPAPSLDATAPMPQAPVEPAAVFVSPDTLEEQIGEPRPRRALVVGLSALVALVVVGLVVGIVNAPEEESAPVAVLPAPPPRVVAHDAGPALVEPTVVDAGAPKMSARPVKLVGPSDVVWRIPGRRAVSSGRTVELPASVKRLVAFHKVLRGVTNVPIQDGVADYGSVGKGRLAVTVLPWAHVRIGDLQLGTTPLRPHKLPAGRYTLTFECDGRTQTRVTRVRRGQTARVQVRFENK